jgi:transcriptional regulator with XRE-family HTH domain
MERFGEKLRLLRERHSLTQQELADKLEFHQAHLYRLETGKKKPNAELLVKLSRLFGVSVDALVKDELEVGE